jgi:aspartate aminotransferase
LSVWPPRRGVLYVFERTPIADDIEYCRQLAEHGILAVLGTGFARPGYMRLALTASLVTIEGAIAGLGATFRSCQVT